MTFDIVTVYAGVVVTLVLLVLVKEIKKEYAPIMITALSVILLGFAIRRGMPLFEYIKGLGDGVGEEYFYVLFKCFGIAVATQMLSDMCCDFGAQSLSGKVEFVGKIGILMTTVPLVEALLELSERLL